MTSVLEIQTKNRELARKINEEARADLRSPYAGKLVGIANGEVVVVAETWDEVYYRLHQIEPDPEKTFGIIASHDYSKVEWIRGVNECPG